MQNLVMSQEELKFLREELFKKYDKLLIEAESLALKLKEIREQIQTINKSISG